MLFDGAQAELPTATLRSSASQARHRVVVGDLHRWLADRWRWLRPRTVPLLVAFAGMFAILGATKYLSTFAAHDSLTRSPAYGVVLTAPDMPGASERHHHARPGSDAKMQPVPPRGLISSCPLADEPVTDR